MIFLIQRIITFLCGLGIGTLGVFLLIDQELLWGSLTLVVAVWFIIAAILPNVSTTNEVSDKAIGEVLEKAFFELPLRGIIKVFDHIF